MTITGTVINKGEVLKLGTSEKQTLVIKTDEQYSQEIPIDFWTKLLPVAKGLNVGDKAEFSINLRGSKGKGDRWFAAVSAWKVNKLTSSDAAQLVPEAEEDDLPF